MRSYKSRATSLPKLIPRRRQLAVSPCPCPCPCGRSRPTPPRPFLRLLQQTHLRLLDECADEERHARHGELEEEEEEEEQSVVVVKEHGELQQQACRGEGGEKSRGMVSSAASWQYRHSITRKCDEVPVPIAGQGNGRCTHRRA